MTPEEILKPICSTDESRPGLLTPFGIDFEGRRWTVATNGHNLVALPFPRVLRTDAPDVVGALLTKEPRPNFRASVASLKEWAGSPVPAWTACETCHGEPPHQFCPACGGGPRCDGCGGAGGIREMMRPGALLEGVVNKVLLAQVLATLPADVTHLLIGQRCAFCAYMLRAKDWIGSVMPLRDSEAGSKFTELEPA